MDTASRRLARRSSGVALCDWSPDWVLNRVLAESLQAQQKHGDRHPALVVDVGTVGREVTGSLHVAKWTSEGLIMSQPRPVSPDLFLTLLRLYHVPILPWPHRKLYKTDALHSVREITHCIYASTYHLPASESTPRRTPARPNIPSSR